MWLIILIVMAVAGYFLGPRVVGASRVSPSGAPGAAKGRGFGAIPVVAVKAIRGNIGEYITGLGNVTPIYTVTVKTRVDGQLMEVHYKEGDIVQKARRCSKSTRALTRCSSSRPKAPWSATRRCSKTRKVDLSRYEGLLKQDAIPEQQFATQKALVAQDEGVVKADQGQIDSAKLNLVYCHIAAPITGRVGLRLVDPGNIVHATDTTGLVVITQIQPISVIFPVAEDQLPLILPKFRAGQKLEVDAWDRDQTHKLATGTLATMDNQIDQTTGTVRLRADFPNTDDALFPNQFVYARLLVEQRRGVTLIPTAAIQRTTTSTYVWSGKARLHGHRARDYGGHHRRRPSAGSFGCGARRRSRCHRRGQAERRREGECAGAGPRARRPASPGRKRGGQTGGSRAVSPSRTFILRPVATSLLMVGILLAGAVGYSQLPVSALPEVDYPTIQVVTFYPGASPDVMASSVTAPLERQFGQVPGLQQMTSTSSDGSSVITLQFNLSLSIDVAEQEVQQSINASGTYLPVDLPTPPIYSKTNPADTPILTLALMSKTMPLTKVEDLADTRLAPKISQLAGVGLVSISGGQKPAVRIRANPTVLASYGLNLEDLRSNIIAANVNQAKGSFDGQHQSYQIGANDQLLSSADYEPLMVAYRNGAPVELRRGQRDGRCRKHPPGRLDEQRASRDREHPAPAGRQHHRRGGPHQAAAAAVQTTLPASVQVRFSPTAPSPFAPRCRTWNSS